MPTQQKPEKVKIPPEMAKRLKDLTANFATSKQQLAALKKLGIDTKEVEEKLDWAEMAQKVLLEDFT